MVISFSIHSAGGSSPATELKVADWACHYSGEFPWVPWHAANLRASWWWLTRRIPIFHIITGESASIWLYIGDTCGGQDHVCETLYSALARSLFTMSITPLDSKLAALLERVCLHCGNGSAPRTWEWLTDSYGHLAVASEVLHKSSHAWTHDQIAYT